MAFSFTSANPVVVGGSTRKSDYDVVHQNTRWNKDVVLADDGESSGAIPHDHSGQPLGVTVLYNDLDFTGSNITDIATRHHSDLQLIGPNDHIDNLTDIPTRYHNDTADRNAGVFHQEALISQKGLMSTTHARVVANNRADVATDFIPNTSTWVDLSQPILNNPYAVIDVIIAGDNAANPSYVFQDFNTYSAKIKRVYLNGSAEIGVSGFLATTGANPAGNIYFRISGNAVQGFCPSGETYSYWCIVIVRAADDGSQVLIN